MYGVDDALLSKKKICQVQGCRIDHENDAVFCDSKVVDKGVALNIIVLHRLHFHVVIELVETQCRAETRRVSEELNLHTHNLRKPFDRLTSHLLASWQLLNPKKGYTLKPESSCTQSG
jgi:hypothetical protein